jgi:putative spermidine/putrescine transport system permease protein
MATLAPPRRPLLTRVSTAVARRRWLRLLLMLGPPAVWLVVVYLGSLFSLLAQSFFVLDDFTGVVERTFSLDTWQRFVTRSNITITLRTVGMATAVTLASVAVAFPLSYYVARFARGRIKALLVLGALLPLWSSYLVRVYAWKTILSNEGAINWVVERIGLDGLVRALLAAPVVGGPSLSASMIGQWMVFLYIWLPYMVLPIIAAVEKIPPSLLEASADLGARSRVTFRKVIWPLAVPGVIAGSIFTFSLTLGDYIIPQIIGNSSPFIGLAIYSYQGVAGDLPQAAAFSFVPMGIMAIYLTLARKTGAFENI